MCGLVAAGKTTVAKQLAETVPAVRLSRDEWMIRLYGLPHDDPAYVERLEPCTELLWDIALQIASVGTDVVLDWNFWNRQRRADAAQRVAGAGFAACVHWVDIPLEDVIRRADGRLASQSPLAHRIDEATVRHFATIFEPPTDDEGLPILCHTET